MYVSKELQIGFLESGRFDGTSYNVGEEEGMVEIPVGIIEGALGTVVRVQVATINGTAIGTYIHTLSLYTFDQFSSVVASQIVCLCVCFYTL